MKIKCVSSRTDDSTSLINDEQYLDIMKYETMLLSRYYCIYVNSYLKPVLLGQIGDTSQLFFSSITIHCF